MFSNDFGIDFKIKKLIIYIYIFFKNTIQEI